jgi:hypothetical protein
LAVTTIYTQACRQLGEIFSKIRDAQFPDEFINQILKDLGYKVNDDMVFLLNSKESACILLA